MRHTRAIDEVILVPDGPGRIQPPLSTCPIRGSLWDSLRHFLTREELSLTTRRSLIGGPRNGWCNWWIPDRPLDRALRSDGAPEVRADVRSASITGRGACFCDDSTARTLERSGGKAEVGFG